MLSAGGNNINACCVDVGVSKNICQLCNILFNAIKGSGKQMAKVMWEHLLG